MRFLTYVVAFLLASAIIWVPMVLLFWFLGAFDSCHTTLTYTCP